MRHANDVANAMPRKGKELSPLELFSGVQVAPKLHHFHVFGCPTYMLDTTLQSGQGAHKWKQHSRLGVYLGPSPNHTRSATVILNPQTSHVSPQFHIKFYDFFETVQDKSTDLDAPDPEWKYLSSFAKKGPAKVGAMGGLDSLYVPRRGATAATIPPQESTGNDCSPDPHQDLPLPLENDDDEPNLLAPPQPVAPAAPPQPQQELPTVAARQTRRSRVIKNIPRYVQSVAIRNRGLAAWELLIDQDEQEESPMAATEFATQKALEEPIAYAATDNPDILYWDQAMKAHDRDKFIEAVGVELDSHERMGNYEPVPIDKVPKGTKLLDVVWSMRRKRHIKTQEVYKWKVRLNVHGGQREHGVHYWDTYAPVVTWQTVRLFPILSSSLGGTVGSWISLWHTCKHQQKCPSTYDFHKGTKERV